MDFFNVLIFSVLQSIVLIYERLIDIEKELMSSPVFFLLILAYEREILVQNP